MRPYEHAIAMHTMHYPDEIRGTRELDLPEEQTAITEQEMAMAMMLIDQLSADYEPSEHEDQYRLALEKVIEGKLTSQEVVTATPSCFQGQGHRPDGSVESKHSLGESGDSRHNGDKRQDKGLIQEVKSGKGESVGLISAHLVPLRRCSG